MHRIKQRESFRQANDGGRLIDKDESQSQVSSNRVHPMVLHLECREGDEAGLFGRFM